MGECEHGKILGIDCDQCKYKMNVEKEYEQKHLPNMQSYIEMFCRNRKINSNELKILQITPTQTKALAKLHKHICFIYKYGLDKIKLTFAVEDKNYELTDWDIIPPKSTKLKKDKTMSTTLDIRENKHISEIKFDNSDARVLENVTGLEVLDEDQDNYVCCDWENLDNFILAARKAKELWFKKPDQQDS